MNTEGYHNIPHDPGGRFSRFSVIGKGGMGLVYKAYDEVMKEWVALKYLASEYADDPEFLERFVREARQTRRLRHPNIIAVHDIQTLSGRPYISMEYIDGTDLGSVLRGGALSLGQTRYLVHQILAGLKEAHDNGVTHRDIKPQNMLIDRGGKLKITDFGIAKAISESMELTQTGAFMGSPKYMSPEQIQGIKDLDHRSDIYSAGIVIYEMVTGSLPYSAETSTAFMYKHVNEKAEDPKKKRADLPTNWARAIEKCLAKEPEQRFANVEELTKIFLLPEIKDEPLPEEFFQTAQGEHEPQPQAQDQPSGMANVVTPPVVSGNHPTQTLAPGEYLSIEEAQASIQGHDLNDLDVKNIQAQEAAGEDLIIEALPDTTTGTGADDQMLQAMFEQDGKEADQPWKVSTIKADEKPPDNKEIAKPRAKSRVGILVGATGLVILVLIVIALFILPNKQESIAAAMQDGDYEKALILLESIKVPGPETVALKGRAYSALGLYSEAIQAYQIAFSADPELAGGDTVFEDILSALDTQAKSDAVLLLIQVPTDKVLDRFRYYQSKGDCEFAVEIASFLPDTLLPGDQLKSAACQCQLEKYPACRQAYQELINSDIELPDQLYSKICEDLAQLIELDIPGNWHDILNLVPEDAVFAAAQKAQTEYRYQTALILIEMIPDYNSPQANRLRGNIFCTTGDYDRGLTAYKQALQEDISLAEDELLINDALSALEHDNDQATDLLRLLPPERLWERAMEEMDLDNCEGALPIMEVFNYRTDAEYFIKRGHCRIAAKEVSSGLEDLTKAFAKEPDLALGPMIIDDLVFALRFRVYKKAQQLIVDYVGNAAIAPVERAIQNGTVYQKDNARQVLKMLQSEGTDKTSSPSSSTKAPSRSKSEYVVLYIGRLKSSTGCTKTRINAAKRLGELGDRKALPALKKARSQMPWKSCSMGEVREEVKKVGKRVSDLLEKGGIESAPQSKSSQACVTLCYTLDEAIAKLK